MTIRTRESLQAQLRAADDYRRHAEDDSMNQELPLETRIKLAIAHDWLRATDGYRRRGLMDAFDTLRREHAKGYRLDTTSHLDAHHNRVVIKGSFMAMREMGASKETSIAVMRSLKKQIRARDAEPAAWFFGPGRHLWVRARMDRGELTDHAEIGRALMGEELENAA